MGMVLACGRWRPCDYSKPLFRHTLVLELNLHFALSMMNRLNDLGDVKEGEEDDEEEGDAMTIPHSVNSAMTPLASSLARQFREKFRKSLPGRRTIGREAEFLLVVRDRSHLLAIHVLIHVNFYIIS